MMYSPLAEWQTRIVTLYPGRLEEDVYIDLIVVNILHSEGVAVHYTSQQSKLNYEALSYVWGNPARTQDIKCGSINVGVSENLFQALRSIRWEDRERNIWVDAICIDQSNTGEKNTQVQNMMLIYQKATRVVAWLGNPWAPVQESESTKSPTPTSPRRVNDELSAAIKHIYNSPLWDRIWIQQEITVAREVEFYLGCIALPAALVLVDPVDALRSFEGLLAEDIDSLQQIWSEKIERLTVWRKQAQKFSFGSMGILRNSSTLDFLDLLMQTRHLGATEPRDHIYALVGLAGLSDNVVGNDHRSYAQHCQLRIDYGLPLVEIYAETTFLILQSHGRLDMSIWCALNLPVFRDTSLWPSWVVDWRSVQPGGLKNQWTHEYCMEKYIEEAQFFRALEPSDDPVKTSYKLHLHARDALAWFKHFTEINKDRKSSLELRVCGRREDPRRYGPLYYNEAGTFQMSETVLNDDIVVSLYGATTRVVLRHQDVNMYQIVGIQPGYSFGLGSRLGEARDFVQSDYTPIGADVFMAYYLSNYLESTELFTIV